MVAAPLSATQLSATHREMPMTPIRGPPSVHSLGSKGRRLDSRQSRGPPSRGSQGSRRTQQSRQSEKAPSMKLPLGPIPTASRGVLELQQVCSQSDDVAWLYGTVQRAIQRAREDATPAVGKVPKTETRQATTHARVLARRKLREAWTTFQSTARSQRSTNELQQAFEDAAHAIPQPTLLRGAKVQVNEVQVLEAIRAWRTDQVCEFVGWFQGTEGEEEVEVTLDELRDGGGWKGRWSAGGRELAVEVVSGEQRGRQLPLTFTVLDPGGEDGVVLEGLFQGTSGGPGGWLRTPVGEGTVAALPGSQPFELTASRVSRKQLTEAAATLWRWKYHPEISRDVCRSLCRWVADPHAAEDVRASVVRQLQDHGVPAALLQVVHVFHDHPEVPAAAVPVLGVLSVDLLIRMMEMQLDDYVQKRGVTTSFVAAVRCLAQMAKDEQVRAEIVASNGREVLDFTLSSRWAASCRLELEALRRRLLVEPLRTKEDDAMSEPSATAIEDLFTPQQLDDFQAAFENFDLDGSGTIDKDEIGAVMRKLGVKPSDAQLSKMIVEVDTDGSGDIGWTEFLSLMARQVDATDAEDEFQRCFEFFDPANCGYILVTDFISKLRQLNQDFADDELEALIVASKFETEEYDRITYKEFVKMMMSQ